MIYAWIIGEKRVLKIKQRIKMISDRPVVLIVILNIPCYVDKDMRRGIAS